jgi:hypothetical protein
MVNPSLSYGVNFRNVIWQTGIPKCPQVASTGEKEEVEKWCAREMEKRMGSTPQEREGV